MEIQVDDGYRCMHRKTIFTVLDYSRRVFISVCTNPKLLEINKSNYYIEITNPLVCKDCWARE